MFLLLSQCRIYWIVCLYSLLYFLHSILCILNYFTLCILWPLSVAAPHNMAHADLCTALTTSVQCLITQTLSLSVIIVGTIVFCFFYYFFFIQEKNKPTLTLTVTANRIGSKSPTPILSTINSLTLPLSHWASRLFACCSLVEEFIRMEEQSERGRGERRRGGSITTVKNHTQLQQHPYKLALWIKVQR